MAASWPERPALLDDASAKEHPPSDAAYHGEAPKWPSGGVFWGLPEKNDEKTTFLVVYGLQW